MPASSTRLFKGEFHKILLNTQVKWPKPESPLTADRARLVPCLFSNVLIDNRAHIRP
jgi:hypothetical protein